VGTLGDEVYLEEVGHWGHTLEGPCSLLSPSATMRKATFLYHALQP
jgi:hypothetical protein